MYVVKEVFVCCEDGYGRWRSIACWGTGPRSYCEQCTQLYDHSYSDTRTGHGRSPSPETSDGKQKEQQADHGEAASSSYQQLPQRTEDADTGRHEKRSGEAYQVGEGRHLGDDSETSGEPAAPAGCNVGSYRPQRAEQVPGRVQ